MSLFTMERISPDDPNLARIAGEESHAGLRITFNFGERNQTTLSWSDEWRALQPDVMTSALQMRRHVRDAITALGRGMESLP